MDYIERKELGMGKSMTRLWLRAKNRDLMEIANALRLTIQQLQRKVKLYEDQFDILDINLTQIEND